MKNSIYAFEGKSDVGYQKTVNEDYLDAALLDEHTLLLLIADGTRSEPASGFQPASIAIHEIRSFICRIYKEAPDMLFQRPGLFLSEAMIHANRVLTVFTACEEERFSGFGCSLTCCFLYTAGEKQCAAVLSAGNTRLYLIRVVKGVPSIHQLTTDHTKAADMVLAGLISEEEYYTHLDRLVLTSGLGVQPEPKIQILDELSIRKDDILLMTTDGIHYSIRPEALSDIVLQSGSCAEAVNSLIEAAKLEKYPDNVSALVAYIP